MDQILEVFEVCPADSLAARTALSLDLANASGGSTCKSESRGLGKLYVSAWAFRALWDLRSDLLDIC